MDTTTSAVSADERPAALRIALQAAAVNAGPDLREARRLPDVQRLLQFVHSQ